MTKPKAKRQNCINRLQDVAGKRDSLPDAVKRLRKLEKSFSNIENNILHLALLIAAADDDILDFSYRMDAVEGRLNGDEA